MDTITHEIDYGNYRFVVELEMDTPWGCRRHTLWAAEKVDVDTLPLSHFTIPQLLSALPSTHKASRVARYEWLKRNCRDAFEVEIKDLVHFCSHRCSRRKKRRYEEAKDSIRFIRGQIQTQMQQADKDFFAEEILTLDRSIFDRSALQQASNAYHQERCIRDFYFDEANNDFIHSFCQQFALDPVCRQEVLAGEPAWLKRNMLFVRNLPLQPNVPSDHHDHSCTARDFFYWIDAHLEEILALPTYRHLKELDSASPCTRLDDPLLQPAMRALNQLPGIVTRFSCQGVSGTLCLQGHELVTPSPHERFAYVSFTTLSHYAHDAIVDLLPAFPAIATTRKYGIIALCSRGDNLRFHEDMLALAHRLQERVDDAWRGAPVEPGDLTGRFDEHSVALYGDAAQPDNLGGLIPSRLDWLCQPGQIERTLQLLFHLSHWIKERDHLLYADRQGLNTLKTAIIREAYMHRLIIPAVYSDGTQHFAHDYYPEQAADIATDTFIHRLEALFAREQLVPDADQIDPAVLTLFTHISGSKLTRERDIHAIGEKRIYTYILAALDALIEQARLTRLPIAWSDLDALGVQPIDLFDIQTSYQQAEPGWGILAARDARKLDPEQHSRIAFHYHSPTASFCLHLPYRIAETFLPEPVILQLKGAPATSQERGEVHGAPLTNPQPLHALLKDLCVDIKAICPHNLIQKGDYAHYKPGVTPYWEGEGGEEEF